MIQPIRFGTSRRRSGDLLQMVSLNLNLDQFVKEILNLDRESLYLVCSLCYNHFDFSILKMGLIKVNLIVTFYIPPSFKCLGDSESEVRIAKFPLYEQLYLYLY